MRLTVKERILLHLLPYGGSKKDFEVPRAVAQEGIAEACWVNERHLTQYLRPLATGGLVHERRAHVRGVRQRRKVYSLTELGAQAAIKLRDNVMMATVQVEDESGVRTLTIKQAIAAAPGPVTPLAILRFARNGRPIRIDDVALLSGRLRVDMLGEAPRVEGFVGRAAELEAITAEGGGPRLFVIRGVPGIGKSSLASRTCELLRGKRNLFWHRIRPWDSRASVLARLGIFLGALGKPGLRAVLMRGQAERAGEVLREDLPGTKAVLVFDDAQEADVTLQPLFRILLDALSSADDVRVLVLTRTALPFYSRNDIVLDRIVRELDLEGLNAEEVSAYLAQHGLSSGAAEFARRLHGHPLFLELLRAHNPLEGALVDVHRYLEEEVYTKLPQPERGMMKLASLYRVPVPRAALFADPQWSHDVLLSLTHRSLLRRIGETEERFEAHDSIRDFFADVLTSKERRSLADFAVEQLRALASEARDARRLHRCSDYLSSAVGLATTPTEQAVLYEALGDVCYLLGDLDTVARAYEAAARLAPDIETRVRAHRKMATALEDWGDSTAAAREVQAGMETLGDTLSVEKGWLLLARSRGHEAAVRYEKAREDVDAALAIFRESGDTYGEARAVFQLVDLVKQRPRRPEDPEPRELMRDVLQLATVLDDPELAARAHIMMTLIIAGDTAEVQDMEKHFDAAETLIERLDNYRIRLDFLSQRAALRGSMDTNFEGRAADCREIIRLARSVRSEFYEAYGMYLLAAVSAVKGDLDEARRGYEEAADTDRRYGQLFGYGNTLFHLGRVCLMQGDADGVRRAREAIEAPAVKESLERTVYAVEICALDLLTKGDLDGAGKLFEAVIERLRRRRDEGATFVMELPRAHYLYGAALRAFGREDEAQKHLDFSREYLKADRRFGHLLEMEEDVPRLTAGLRRILGFK